MASLSVMGAFGVVLASKGFHSYESIMVGVSQRQNSPSVGTIVWVNDFHISANQLYHHLALAFAISGEKTERKKRQK